MRIKESGISYSPKGVEKGVAKAEEGTVMAMDTQFRYTKGDDGGFDTGLCLRMWQS